MEREARTTRALITGASSGIGASLARRLARRHEVWVAARRADRLAEVVAAITAEGLVAHAVVLDVGKPDDAAVAVEQLDAEVGGFDLVVANAGVGGGARAAGSTSYRDAAEIITTNTLGALATLLPVLPAMKERARAGRRGHVAAVSSLAAQLPLPTATDYGASKAALSFYMEGLMMDLPAQGIDVTLIHPGFVKSEMTDKNKFEMNFILETDDAARIIDDALAARAQMVRFPAVTAGVMALASWMPRALIARATRQAMKAPKGS